MTLIKIMLIGWSLMALLAVIIIAVRLSFTWL
jgi:hypothetical protein